MRINATWLTTQVSIDIRDTRLKKRRQITLNRKFVLVNIKPNRLHKDNAEMCKICQSYHSMYKSEIIHIMQDGERELEE